jgi:UDP-N-acetyl-D-mannosaminuronic acid transferase (WecB/TagA/CpsF family)
MVNKVPVQTYYKSHLLDFFRTMIFYKDTHITLNQSRILAKLQDSKKKNIYYRSDKTNPDGMGLTPKYLEKLIDKWEMMN